MSYNTTLILKLINLNSFLCYNSCRCKEEDVMQVAQYLFQSPYTSPVQVGRLDPSSSQDQGTSDANTQPIVSSKTQPKAKEVVQTQEVQVSVDTSTESTHLLDVVA